MGVHAWQDGGEGVTDGTDAATPTTASETPDIFSTLKKSFIRLSMPIFPLHTVFDGKCTCGDPECEEKENQGKHPIVVSWKEERTTNSAKIQAWIDQYGKCNWGGVTGKASGKFVVDIDPRHGGTETFNALEKEYGKIPNTRLHKSGGGGLHIIFEIPRGMMIKNGSNVLGPGVDIKGEDGYIVLPPSRHISGGMYEILNDVPPTDPPGWLINLIQNGNGTHREKISNSPKKSEKTPKFKLPDKIPDGTRNSTLFSYARSLAMKGISKNAAICEVQDKNRERCAIPLPDSEVESIVNSAYDAGKYDVVSPGESARVDPEIHEEAMKILTYGDPIEYLRTEFHKLHIGDDAGFYGLTASFGCQLAGNTDGLQPSFTGKSGGGKTDICLAYFHLLPDEFKRRGSFSNMSLFYEPLNTGTVIMMDDAQNLTDDYKDMVKQATSHYQEPYSRLTVKQQTAVTLTLPARPVFLLTSVDGAFQDQILNRQLALTVDETSDQDIRVMDATISRYQAGKPKFPETDEVKTCREMWRILKTLPPVNVAIPFKINWQRPENRRNLAQFLDTIAGFTAIMQYQRERGADNTVIAKKEDGTMARDKVWSSISRSQVSKLTGPQIDVLRVIATTGEHDTMTDTHALPRPDVQRMLNWTSGKLSRAVHGIKGEGGLDDKWPSFYIQNVTKKEGSKIIQFQMFYLTGSFDVVAQYQNLVSFPD